jgi:hypothetical protein
VEELDGPVLLDGAGEHLAFEGEHGVPVAVGAARVVDDGVQLSRRLCEFTAVDLVVARTMSLARSSENSTTRDWMMGAGIRAPLCMR